MTPKSEGEEAASPGNVTPRDSEHARRLALLKGDLQELRDAASQVPELARIASVRNVLRKLDQFTSVFDKFFSTPEPQSTESVSSPKEKEDSASPETRTTPELLREEVS